MLVTEVRGAPPGVPTLRGLSLERTPLLRVPAGRAPSVLRTVPLVRPASRPLTPAWRVVPTVPLVRPASRPLTPAWRVVPTALPVLREPLPTLLRVLLEREGLLTLLLDERLEPLNELLRDEEELLLRLLLIELWLLPDERLLLIELLWLLPPLRPPPPRCAKAGVALSAKAIITSVITFEVFMLLLLSFLVSFSAAKILPFSEGNSETITYFSPSTYVAAGGNYV